MKLDAETPGRGVFPILLLLCVSAPLRLGAAVDFTRDVAPALGRCQACHGAKLQLSGLRLDTRAAMLTGGKSGPAAVPGSSASSRLIEMISSGKMPPSGEKLTSPQIAALRAWIDEGARWPEGGLRHWSLVKPQRSALPSVHQDGWVRNPIDAFILARLEAEGLKPSPEADRRTLIRRVSLDLTGLPPALEEVAAFLADQRPDAYERLVDRLLASPHYGEKWARHWMDLARYADSDGYEKDMPRPHAWRWRHWLIEALNRDLPFDQFTVETIAGDLLPHATVDQKIATGFQRNTLTNREGGTDPEQFRFEQVLDRTSTVGTVWLGLTAGCAQCHDHKFDPLTQKEFYQLFAFFDRAEEQFVDAPLPGEAGPYYRVLPEYQRKREEIYAKWKVRELQEPWEDHLRETRAKPGRELDWDFALNVFRVLEDSSNKLLTLGPSRRDERQNETVTRHFVQYCNSVTKKERLDELKWSELQEELKKLDATLPWYSLAPVLAEDPDPPKTSVRIRGDFRELGAEVQPATPAFLPPAPPDPKPSRLTLARRLISPENPLTARVTVNRMWQELFGRGIVRTSEDFGRQGELPSHPELLDWLAVEFREGGWSTKRLHRLIVTSAAYRQSSHARPELLERDPNNVLLARQSRLRLDAELIRDEALSVAGLLNTAVGGKSVRPPQPKGISELSYRGSAQWIESPGGDRYRRGLYTHMQRTSPYPMLVNFDAPNANLTCSRRQRSNTPLQALNLLNDSVFYEAAQALAIRLVRDQPGAPRDRIQRGFELCLARPATGREADRLESYYRKQQQIFESDPSSAGSVFAVRFPGVSAVEGATWVAVARTLLNLDEFITRE